MVADGANPLTGHLENSLRGKAGPSHGRISTPRCSPRRRPSLEGRESGRAGWAHTCQGTCTRVHTASETAMEVRDLPPPLGTTWARGRPRMPILVCDKPVHALSQSLLRGSGECACRPAGTKNLYNMLNSIPSTASCQSDRYRENPVVLQG